MSSIGTNIATLIAQRFLQSNNALVNRSLQRLATAHRINRAADDPSGLIVSEHLRAYLATIEAESRALQRANHVAATAEGALGEISGLLRDANALAVAAANETGMSDAERQALQLEMDSIISTVNRIAGSTTFAGQALLDGSLSLRVDDASLSIDAVSAASLGAIEIDGERYTLAAVGSGGALNLVTGDTAGAQQAIAAAVNQVASMRGSIGAFQSNVIESAISGLQVTFENVAAANSLVRDTDFAAEMSELVRAQILAHTSLLSLNLANTMPRSVLSILA